MIQKSVWKFPVGVSDLFSVDMPKNAEILSVQVQHEKPCMWALVDINAEKEKRYFQIFGTGHNVDSATGKYIGTFQIFSGDLVFHLFEVA